MNRSTFYLHYENMGDLLTEALEYINSRFLTYFDTDGAAVIKKCSEGDIDETYIHNSRIFMPISRIHQG